MTQQTFDHAAHQIASQVADLVIKKQKKYGPDNITKAPFGVKVYLTNRIYDKTMRMVKVINTNENLSYKDMQEIWADIAGLAIVGLMDLEDKFELPLKDKPKGETIQRNMSICSKCSHMEI